jgi:hypothetical protein
MTLPVSMPDEHGVRPADRGSTFRPRRTKRIAPPIQDSDDGDVRTPGIPGTALLGSPGRLNKRRLVAVEGRLQPRSWGDESRRRRWKTEIIAERVELLAGRGRLAMREVADLGRTRPVGAHPTATSSASELGLRRGAPSAARGH